MKKFVDFISFVFIISFFCWIFYPVFSYLIPFLYPFTFWVEWAISINLSIALWFIMHVNENTGKDKKLSHDTGILICFIILAISVFTAAYSAKIQSYKILPCTKWEIHEHKVCYEVDYDRGGSSSCISGGYEEQKCCVEKTYETHYADD